MDRKRNAKWRATVDGCTWVFVLRAKDKVIVMKKLGHARSKQIQIPPYQLVDAATGQMRLL